MKVLGISGFFHHDAAAALLVDGVVVAAAEEERFSRVKHAPGQLPIHAARWCLEAAGLTSQDLDALAVSWSLETCRRLRRAHLARCGPSLRVLRAVTIQNRSRARRHRAKIHRFRRDLDLREDRPTVAVPHHRAHAASAALFSGFGESAVFTADGRGELDAGSLALWDGRELLDRGIVLLPDSLGMFYSSFTQYLGFRPNSDEYKVMGMAAYGDPTEVDLTEFLRVTEDGYTLKERHTGLALPIPKGRRLFSDRFIERWGPPRDEGCLAAPDRHIAAAVQDALERAALARVRSGLGDDIARTGRLCLAGGVCLNVKMNRALIDGLGGPELYVAPASSDAGCALGAAGWTSLAGGQPPKPLPHAFLGPVITDDDAVAALDRSAVPYECPVNLPAAVAERLAAGRVVGLCHGAMEYGPRALGNRSVLAHPGLQGMADRINETVKFRETWRPFCPSVLDGHIQDLCGEDRESPYMTLAFPVRPAWRDRIAEVVHVDGSTRPQTVDPDRAPLLYEILSAFYKETGLPALLNTSYNRRGEPIVCTATEALEVFFDTAMDDLVLGPFLVKK